MRHAGHAATSVAKTTLGIDRASEEQVEARLDVCRQCPGQHAVWRDEDVHTCGPMLASMREAGQGIVVLLGGDYPAGCTRPPCVGKAKHR